MLIRRPDSGDARTATGLVQAPAGGVAGRLTGTARAARTPRALPTRTRERPEFAVVSTGGEAVGIAIGTPLPGALWVVAFFLGIKGEGVVSQHHPLPTRGPCQTARSRRAGR